MRPKNSVYAKAIKMYRCPVGCSCKREDCSECYACMVYPSIELVGDASIEIEVWGQYEEQGAIWTDSLDGTGTILTPTTWEVDVNTPWTYILTYTYTNSQGNSVTITRTVTVV